MIPTGNFIRVVSGFYFNGKAVKARTYTPMTSIPVPGQTGNIIPLEVVPATDGSGTYVLVVALQDPEIDVGTVDVNLTYNLNPPVLHNGEMTGFQSDINGNLKVTLAQGTNSIGGVYPAPTASGSFGITPGSSAEFESSHVIKAGPGNLYSLYVVTQAVGGFLMTFNATTIPADGPVTPVECIPVPANGVAGISTNGSPPDHYSSGIVAVFSFTGPFQKTTNNAYGNAQYSSGQYGDMSASAFFKWTVN